MQGAKPLFDQRFTSAMTCVPNYIIAAHFQLEHFPLHLSLFPSFSLELDDLMLTFYT